MLTTPEILDTDAQLAAVIHLNIAREDIHSLMAPAITEVLAALSAQGIMPAGPLFSNHLSLDAARFDFEVGFPVTQPVTPVGRVKAGELPAARVARTVYQGPYEGLGAAWGEFMVWLGESGHAQGPELWESYLSGPATEPDPAQWRTELNRAVTA
jgi:effector-binding domain-containing protein